MDAQVDAQRGLLVETLAARVTDEWFLTLNGDLEIFTGIMKLHNLEQATYIGTYQKQCKIGLYSTGKIISS